MTLWAGIAYHSILSPITYQQDVMTNCMSAENQRERWHLYVTMIRAMVQRRMDWRMNLPEGCFPHVREDLLEQDLEKKPAGWRHLFTGMIGREDRGYFGRHIWAPHITLGGHSRHYKLILGKEADQRTLPLPASHPAGCLCPSMSMAIVQWAYGHFHIKEGNSPA